MPEAVGHCTRGEDPRGRAIAVELPCSFADAAAYLHAGRADRLCAAETPPARRGFQIQSSAGRTMKPIHGSLLAACLWGCGSAGVGDAPRPTPGSRVVMPELPQPRVQPPDAGSAAPSSLVISIPSAPVGEAAQPESDPTAEPGAEPTAAAEATPAIPELDSKAALDPAVVPTIEPPVETTATGVDAPIDLASGAQASAATGEDARQAELRDQLKRAVDAGRFDEAQELLDALRASPSLESARVAIAAGRWLEAAEVLELARTRSRGRADVCEALGEVQLRLAQDGDSARFAKAREAFEAAGDRPRSLLGLAQSLAALGEPDAAYDAARRARAAIVRSGLSPASFEPPPERVLADCGLELLRARRARLDPVADALDEEIASALNERLQRQPTDGAAHAQWTKLHLEMGRVAEAQVAAERGLELVPDDALLHQLLARSALSAGGPQRLLKVFSRLRAKHPEQALTHWYPALERFKSSAAPEPQKLDPTKSHEAQLREAEEGFRQCRALNPAFESSCLRYEALCRGVRGWQLIRRGLFDAARESFLSMNEVLPGSIALDPATVDPQWDGHLRDGLKGLATIAAELRARGRVEQAADVQADLAAQVPGDGALLRESARAAQWAAEALSARADDLEAAARGSADPAEWTNLRKLARVKDREVGSAKEVERFTKAAAAERAKAREYFERCWQAYLAALELLPGDLRMACDAARVEIYQLQNDHPRAERILREGLRRAEEVLAVAAEPEFELRLAWADSLQDLGYLELTWKGDAEEALRLFRRSVEVGPSPRPKVSETLIPMAIEAAKNSRDG